MPKLQATRRALASSPPSRPANCNHHCSLKYFGLARGMRLDRAILVRLPSWTGGVPPATLSSFSSLVQLYGFQYPSRLTERRESVFRGRPARD
jgi:hypothetical protein